MIIGPTSIAETNAGTLEEVSTTFARTLEKMQYHMSTEKGVLEEYNCHSNNHPSHGTGQGTADSPPKWNFNDNILAKAYGKKAHSCMLYDPTGKINKKNFSVRFIDDITQLHNNNAFDAPAKQLMVQVQHDITLHSKYLWVLGGLLKIMKTHYMLIIWTFLANGPPKLMEEEDLPLNNILIKTTTGYTTKLDRISVHKGSRMLGIRQADSLQMDTEFEHKQGTTLKFGCAIVVCPL
eukprot:14966067-Ditylum_brightwellii.AAC.1